MKSDENIVENSLTNEKSDQSVSDEDHNIIRNVLHESINEYGRLIDKYQVPVYNLLLRMLHDRDTAEELTQQVFVKAYEALPGFRFEFRFFSWLYRIAVNQALNYQKKQRKFVGIENITNLSDESNDFDTSKDVQLQSIIDKMKDKYKSVIILKYFQQLTYQEVAFALNISEKKVRSRLYDARLQLKVMLEKTDYFHSN